MSNTDEEMQASEDQTCSPEEPRKFADAQEEIEYLRMQLANALDLRKARGMLLARAGLCADRINRLPCPDDGDADKLADFKDRITRYTVQMETYRALADQIVTWSRPDGAARVLQKGDVTST